MYLTRLLDRQHFGTNNSVHEKEVSNADTS